MSRPDRGSLLGDAPGRVLRPPPAARARARARSPSAAAPPGPGRGQRIAAAATSTPVRPSSTTSGIAAARHATTGRPAAIASANTMPNPSCTEGRQNRRRARTPRPASEQVTSPRRSPHRRGRARRGAAQAVPTPGPPDDADLQPGDAPPAGRPRPRAGRRRFRGTCGDTRAWWAARGARPAARGEPAPPHLQVDGLGHHRHPVGGRRRRAARPPRSIGW